MLLLAAEGRCEDRSVDDGREGLENRPRERQEGDARGSRVLWSSI